MKEWDLDDNSITRNQLESKTLINKKNPEERKGDYFLIYIFFVIFCKLFLFI